MTYSYLDRLVEKVICDEFMGFQKDKRINWNKLAETKAIKMLAAIENVLNRRIPDSEKLYMIAQTISMIDK